jgi:hypothetical protein
MLAERIARDGAVYSLTSRHRTGTPLNYLHHNHGLGNPRNVNRIYFGTLVTQRNQADEEKAGGVTIGMIEHHWSSWETADGTFSASYASDIQNWAGLIRAQNMQICLATGLHNPPGYVGSLANGHYISHAGATSGEINTVFNQTIRDRVTRYLDQVHAALDFSTIWAIRLTSGGDAELLFPDNAYWAYDSNAQNGSNRPPTMAKCPYPGWVPGNTSITTTQVREWLEWYIGCLADWVAFQMNYFQSKGFRGWYEILSPGSGVRPSVYEAEIGNRLAPINGVLGRGAAWHVLYRLIKDRSRAVVHVSSIADNSGGDDVYVPATDDARTISDTAFDSTSALRFQARIAREYGMPLSGENVGYDSPSSFNAKYVDLGTNGMLQSSFRQIAGAPNGRFYWAHSDRLWPPLNSMPFSNYSTYILARHSDAASVVPPMPK